MKPVRARIAPSPTGYMHIGTLRTALYDYFLARQSGGQFIIRIEDTDQERLVPGTLESLLMTFQTLGIEHDEGPVLQADGSLKQKGEYGPYIQSERLPLYKKYAEQLVEAGHAYHCFCTSERLEKMREDQSALKQAPKYDRLCLKLSKEEVETKLASGESSVIRMKIPEGSCEFVDAIRGKIVFQNTEVDDQVLMKSDGFPTYHLGVVVDDHLMNISHVLRGEEWISSTPKQIILHQMFGWDMPVYAHVPLILNPDKTKLSKRKGDVSVESYLQKGYLSETLINFLSLLGWNPTSDREIFTKEELVKMFDLSKVNKAGAVMNMEKLNWLNGHYLDFLSEAEWFGWCRSILDPKTELEQRLLLLARGRVKNLDDLKLFLLTNSYVFQSVLEYPFSDLLWKSQPTKEEAAQKLTLVRDFITHLSLKDFQDVKIIEERIRAVIQEKAWENGDTLWPLRVALSGRRQSPSPFELLWVYGKEQALARIDEALARLA